LRKGGPGKGRRGDRRFGALKEMLLALLLCPRPETLRTTHKRDSGPDSAHLRVTSTGRDLFDSWSDPVGATAADQLRAGQRRG